MFAEVVLIFFFIQH
uniref:Uncharacterized protein n=1 Tax=Arundo donax TaxID=35708 RepID=A0A0A8ZLR4_ARUDO